MLRTGLGAEEVDVAGKLVVPASACPGALAMAMPRRPRFGPGTRRKPHLGKCHADLKKNKQTPNHKKTTKEKLISLGGCD